MLKLSLQFKLIEIVTMLYYRMQHMKIQEMIEWGYLAPTSYLVSLVSQIKRGVKSDIFM
jgi:hypothetical protein